LLRESWRVCDFGKTVRLAEWVPPVGGALSRHTSTWEVHATANWGTQARPGGAPKQAAEAMPSSRGDARGADRARTRGGGGGKSDPLRRLHLALAFSGFTGSMGFGESRIVDFASSGTSWSLSYRAAFSDRHRSLNLALAPIPTAGSTTPACS
jgi:hypothetical protein